MIRLTYRSLPTSILLRPPIGGFIPHCSHYSSASAPTLERHETSVSVDSHRFTHQWLRDNCGCPECIHPSSRQKLHSSADVSRNLKPQSIQLLFDPKSRSSRLEVFWKPFSLDRISTPKTDAGMNSAGAKPHVSSFDLAWLKSARNDPSPRMIPKFWDAEKVADSKDLEIGFDELMRKSADFTPLKFSRDDDVLRKAVVQLRDYGLLFVTGVPTDDPKIVESVAERFGPIKETFYGRSWDVISIPDAKNIAYTSVELGLHMDLLYYESPPGLQFLHCLKNTVTGGASFFVDSFAAANKLKQESREDFETLRRIPVSFHYENDGHHMHCKHPTIVTNDNNPNDEMMVYYSPPFQGPLDASYEDADSFYAAFRKFTEILERKEMVYERMLREGDLVIFGNRRVLHARRQFDPNSGLRHLKGTYTEWCDFKDRVRVLTSKQT